MDEAIKILREQAILCSRLTELLDKLTDALKNNSLETAEVVKKIDPLVIDLSKNSSKSQEFLQTTNFKNFGEFITAAEEGIHKDVAERLLNQVINLQAKLIQSMQVASRLLANGKDFVNFNLNVLSQTSASPTYGSEAKTRTNSDRRIFDANV